MRLTVWIIAIPALLWGCSSCGSTNGSDADANEDVLEDLDGNADSSVDPRMDTLADIPEDMDLDSDSTDGRPDVPLPCGLELDGPNYDLSFLDPLEGYPRAPTECGECCRQVSFTEHDVISCRFHVLGNLLALTTWDGVGSSLSRAILVDLKNTSQYLVYESDNRSGDLEFISSTYSAAFNGSSLSILHGVRALDNSQMTSTITVYDFINETQEDVWDRLYHLPEESYPYQIEASSSMIAWTDDRSILIDGRQLYTFNIESREELHVATTADCCVSGIGVYGATIVYRDGSSNIFVYNTDVLSSRRVAGVDEYDWDRYSPAIWGNTVAWHDTRNGGTDLSQTHTDIYMTDITVGGEQVVCDHPASQPGGVAVGDGFIVWPDARNDEEHPNLPSSANNWDLYLYDIASGDERQLTDLPGIEACPKIYKNRVYFVMEDDFGIMSVFEITLPEYEGAGE